MRQITQEQRYTIFAMLQQEKSVTEIAQTISKHPSSVYREIKRNADKRSGKYSFELACKKSTQRHKDKNKHIRFTEEIKEQVNTMLALKHSPEQISGRLARIQGATISHESIYQYIYADKRKGGALHSYLRRKGKKYNKRKNLTSGRGLIPNRRDISERPQIVEERSRFGDLEIDTMIGAYHKGCLLTINDRATGLVKIKRLPSKEAALITQATIELLKDWKGIKSITSDNGKEFSQHQEIAKQLKIDFFFAEPYKSWQRGSNENTNGLIRQFVPKKLDLTDISDSIIKAIEDNLNNRPRKRYGYLTPNEVYLQKFNNRGKNSHL